MKRRIKRFTFKRMINTILKYLINVVIGIYYLVLIILKVINKAVAKMFNKLPKVLKTMLIYSLIIGNVPNAIATYKIVSQEVNNYKQVEVVEQTKEETTETTEQIKVEVEQVEETNICNLKEIECKIYNKSIEQGLTTEQAYLLIAISRQETGNWTSNLFVNHNNFGGIYNSQAKQFRSYATQEEGLNAFVNLLKNRYFGKGLNTIEQIGNVYCPVGSNDNGNNKHWIPNVTQFYNEYLKK